MTMTPSEYASIYGPSSGDLVRLADTELWMEISRDDTSYGDEALVGLGKSIRDGMLASSRLSTDSELDLVVTNVVVLDPVLGVVKTNIGIKEGRIVGVGRAGNADIVDNVDLLIGTTTTLIAGEGLIATPGAIDSHVHMMSPRIVPVALSAGVTTFVGMGSGPTWDIGVNPSWTIQRMEEAFAAYPVNVAFLGRGSSSQPEPLERLLEGGASGFKIHEDTGGSPAVIDNVLQVAAEHDVAVAVHFDGLGESGNLADFIEATRGRPVHAYHVEGAGGGPPNLLEVVDQENILPSSTTPTIPYGVNAIDEHVDMIIVCHGLHVSLHGDLAAARVRVRSSTMAAEQTLHDLGAISITNSDSLGMGRIGETLRRTWQMADRMKHLSEDQGEEGSDNERILRYLAKYTINPALTHGLAHEIGSIEPGKLADIVLWKPEMFAVKPEMVVKGGFVAWGAMGEGNASIERSQPISLGAHFGAQGLAPSALSVTFVSARADERLCRVRRPNAVRGASAVRKQAMIRNGALPRVDVDPRSLAVRIDDELVDAQPATELPMNRLYLLG